VICFITVPEAYERDDTHRSQLPTRLTARQYHPWVPADAEQVQELGRKGVASVQQWLEATTFIELNWNVYEHTLMCVVNCLDGSRKKFDLVGSFIGDRKDPVAVECKKYTSPGAQHKYFKEFLAVAYSSTVNEIEQRGGDLKREFLWVTTHPFQLREWTMLATSDKIIEAIGEYPDLLAGKPIDFEIVHKLSERIWLLVMNAKQEEISLSNDELMLVLATLKRKESTL
jgi:hypothetical protein